MSDKKTLGKNIQAYRKKLGFTQESFSEFLGINRTELSYYESGKRLAPISVISRAADIFGIEGYDLYEENPYENSVNLAFAFRAENFNANDLNEISSFKKIVKNYVKLIELKKNE
ncbi:helix-turn-helix transcriptional regulator [Algibacter sp. 2305UL17-15]|uniref:helix-turn-helix domain-containing protein n=1 Tax=Algibacter sp. 2305UL17-15 TaxID=3231268 RepID=UPI00345B339F